MSDCCEQVMPALLRCALLEAFLVMLVTAALPLLSWTFCGWNCFYQLRAAAIAAAVGSLESTCQWAA